MRQQHPGPKERGSDGVVPYWSSHLDRAQSELIVHSGHGVFSNPDAVRETIRILHLALRPTSMSKKSSDQGMPIVKNRPKLPGSRGVDQFLLVQRGCKDSSCFFCLSGSALVLTRALII